MFGDSLIQTQCLTEFLLEQALKQADALDEHLAKTGQTVGPLHGVPVSLKDQFFVEGGETAVGFVAWLDGPASREDEDGIVPVLRAAGAVFHVKTNLPTSMMVCTLFFANEVCGNSEQHYWVDAEPTQPSLFFSGLLRRRRLANGAAWSASWRRKRYW